MDEYLKEEINSNIKFKLIIKASWQFVWVTILHVLASWYFGYLDAKHDYDSAIMLRKFNKYYKKKEEVRHNGV